MVWLILQLRCFTSEGIKTVEPEAFRDAVQETTRDFTDYLSVSLGK